jgi:hypothetical protein
LRSTGLLLLPTERVTTYHALRRHMIKAITPPLLLLLEQDLRLRERMRS